MIGADGRTQRTWPLGGKSSQKAAGASSLGAGGPHEQGQRSYGQLHETAPDDTR